MQKQTSVYIPTPCHEDWNKMTPTQQGKFCGSCSKHVIDFSLMSDSQILNFLSHQSGKLCGRFNHEQLQRPLIETKIKTKKSWWMALAMPLLFLFERSEAQKIVAKPKHHIVEAIDRNNVLLGDIAIIKNEKIITGSVIDENNNPLSFVSIYQKGTKNGTTTDSLGNFSININFDSSSATLIASCIGCETIEKQVNANEPEAIIGMQTKPIRLSDILITSYSYTSAKITLGGAVAVCSRITIKEKIDTVVRKAFNISAFKIFPNPVIKGNNIHLEIKQPGEYQLQLLDNQSRLMIAEELNVVSEKSTSSITIPSNISAGIYYLRLIDDQKKKSYTEKVIIQ